MKQRIRLTSATRPKVIQAIQEAPEGYFVSIEEARRSLQANARLWAMLTDISKQVEWPVNGRMGLMEPADWKDVLSAGLKQENRIAQGLNGSFVMLGARTSEMTVKEMSDLIELMFAFGADNSVKWSEPVYVPEWRQ